MSLAAVDPSLRFPWLDHVKSTLSQYGLGFVWLSQGVSVDVEWLKPKLALVFLDTFRQSWLSSLGNLSKCDNYRSFKSNLEFENYLDNLNDDLRTAMSRFRCRNSRKLPVEAINVFDLDNNFCNLCKMREKGDEFHYLLVCPYFENERKMYIPKYYYTYPVIEKLASLFELRQPNLNKLAILIKTIVKKL